MRFWPIRKPTAVKKSEKSRSSHRSRRMLLEQLENRFAMDAGGTMQSASSLGMVDGRSIVIQEEIATSTDVDMFAFQAKAGQSVEFDIDTPYNGPGGLGSYLRVFDASGRQLAANNDRAAPGERFGFDSYIPITFETEGTYYVGVSNWLNTVYDPATGMSFPPWFNWYTTGTYQLVITSNHVADPVESFVQPTSIVPRAKTVTILSPIWLLPRQSWMYPFHSTGLQVLIGRPRYRPVGLRRYSLTFIVRAQILGHFSLSLVQDSLRPHPAMQHT